MLKVVNLLGTKVPGNCMCYHGRVIIEGCRTKFVLDKYTDIYIYIYIYSEAALIYLCDDIDYCLNIRKIIKKK